MIALKILYYALLIAVGLFLYVRFYEAKAIFFPAKKIVATPLDVGLPFEDIFFLSADGVTLNGWLVRSPSRDAPVLLFLHGNAGNLGNRLDKIAIFHKLGLNVFAIDYRGYGKSQGRPTEEGLYTDARSAYDYLRHRKDFQAHTIILYGESIGCTVAIDLASRQTVAALIAEGAFSSARDMAKVIVPAVPTFLLRVKMDALGKIPAVTAPKLFIHSRYDEIVPFRLARKLFDAAQGPKEFLEIDGDHNQGYALSYGVYTQGLENFLRTYHLIR